MLYVKDLIVNGLYSSYTRKSSKETEGVVNKETYGAIKGTNGLVYSAECFIFRTVFAIDGYRLYTRQPACTIEYIYTAIL